METHGPNSQKADSVVRGKTFILLALFFFLIFNLIFILYWSIVDL